MHRYHKILTHVKKKLGSIIFLENLPSLHNVTFIINKVSSVKRPLAWSSERGPFLSLSTPAAQLHWVPVSRTSVGCSQLAKSRF